jgi:hypothetical protein
MSWVLPENAREGISSSARRLDFTNRSGANRRGDFYFPRLLRERDREDKRAEAKPRQENGMKTKRSSPLTRRISTAAEEKIRRERRRRAANLARHARKCAICHHPRREQIEDDFLRWSDPWHITRTFDLPSRSSLYRHVEALGLIQQRRINLRGVAERLLERVDHASITASAVVRAMRVFAHIGEDGQWFEPPKRIVVTHVHTTDAASLSVAPATQAATQDAAMRDERVEREAQAMIGAASISDKPSRKELQRLALLRQAREMQSRWNGATAAREKTPSPPGEISLPVSPICDQILIGTGKSSREATSD